MRQAAAALLGAGFTVAACYAAGALLIDRLQAALRRDERIPLAFVLGAACLHLAVFAILALHIGYWPVLTALLAATVGAAVWTGAWRGVRTELGKPVAPLSKTLLAIFGLCAGAFAIFYLVNAWAPETSPDGAAYHLAGVARDLRTHGMEPNPTTYGMLSQGVEMLFVPAFAIGRHSAAALVHFAFTIALALVILAYGRRIGKPWAGAAGALFTFASPVVGISGSSAYVDVATAAIVFCVFYWTEIWDEQHGLRLLIPVGLLAGYAYAAKYTAFPIGIYALGFVAWRSRRLRPLGKTLRPVLVVAGSALVMAGPWIARNWIWYQNPLAPFGNWLFRNPYVHVIFEQDYAEYLRHYGLPSLRLLPLEATIRGQYIEGIIGPVFLLLPVAVIALRYQAGRRLLLAGALMFSTYFANIGARFLIPCLPFFSLGMGLALGEAAPLLGALMVFHAASSWPFVLNRYVYPDCWRLARFPYQAALRITPQDDFLRQHSFGYGIARMIEAKVRAGEPVLSMTGIPDSYTTHEILVGFQSAGNQALTDTVNMGWAEGFQPSVGQVFQFPERTARRIRLVQTAPGESRRQWSVHELRFFYRGQELARNLDWRLEAWPNPWEVQMAFDNSLATRWRSGEVAAPGMYLEADFGREEPVDEVRVVTSPDSGPVRLELEAPDPAGRWEKIADHPRQVALAVPPNIRRMATYEMHARGVHYLLIQDTDFGSDDFAGDPEAWGLKLIGHEYGAALYQTIW